ncbi:MAG: 8-amino-7-oxononanoate synthase [Syntrophomonadaceae bacterium]|nr:8-amino-7-oxononanoate synthase [Syntrophomonadaceae bacterium]
MQTLQEILTDLQDKHLYRQLTEIMGAPGPAVRINDQEVILMASNSYLGLNTHPRVGQAAAEAIRRFGTGAGGSRLTTGNTTLHRELEEAIAAFKGTEEAIIYGTGYMTNVGVLTAWARPGDLILSDALNHASIVDGCRLSQAKIQIYDHCDLEHLRYQLQQRWTGQRTLIVTDGVFSMDGDIAPLPEIVEMAGKYRATIMVDDAHATGVLGAWGKGTAEHFGLQKEIAIQVGTLSKALGCEGGFVAGSAVLIDYLRNRSRPFIYSTAMAPANAAAARQAIQVLQAEPQLISSLRRNTDFWRKGLANLGFRLVPGETPIISVLIGETETCLQLSQLLYQEGVFAPAIRPPTVPEGTSRIRTTVMANHTVDQLKQALNAFKSCGQKLGLIS